KYSSFVIIEICRGDKKIGEVWGVPGPLRRRRKNNWRVGLKTKPPLEHYGLRTQTAWGRFLVGEPVAMHRPAKVPLDGMGFPLILAGGLRTIFADVASSPLPERLASLLRSLSADGDERSGEPRTYLKIARRSRSAINVG